jgi:flavin-dependent dehydrogenase
MYDVIIIGARCAGASTSMLLANKGYKVLLVDRATFPKDLPHGHFIHRHGPARLQRWGVLDRIAATNCPPVTTFTTDYGDEPLTGRDIASDGIAFGYGPRRAALDHVLVDAAVQAGAELREGFVVEGFTSDGDRVTGIRARDEAGGPAVCERAALTIGADGRNSRLARAVRAPAYEATAPLTCWYFSYWSGVPADGLEVAVRGRKVLFAFPTNDGLYAVFVGWAGSELPTIRRDVERSLMAAIDEVPELSERIRSGRREERIYGMADVPNFLRRPYGPGWALVGDAGSHKDPFMALGICDAFRDAELLAQAFDDAQSGRRGMDDAMADYERHRNEATMPDYRQNLERARFTPFPDDLMGLRRALQGNARETSRYYLALEGMIPPASFFNAENVQRIAAGAGAHGTAD